MKQIISFATLYLLLLTSYLTAQDFEVVSWNIQSDGSKKDTIAKQLTDKDITGETWGSDVELWGFSEVKNVSTAFAIKHALGKDHYWFILGETGGADKLMAIFNTEKFELLDYFELHSVNFTGTYRAPLVLHLRHKQSGKDFYFMVNHLARTNANVRRAQVKKLVSWIAEQTIPIIAVGDYNFDYRIDGGYGNQSYKMFMKKGVMQWKHPENMLMTQCAKKYNSILDFIFTRDIAGIRHKKSKIISWQGDCPDDQNTSDHRPIIGYFTF